ncbi:hypothetical protein LTR85_007270 [Meristemomyces frigidus]|nr:hypothetical protein LTR85_007270 [Meristemomyces frigidus]
MPYNLGSVLELRKQQATYQETAEKGPMAFLKQESYAHNLRDSLDEIKKLSEQFDRLAVTCDRAKLDNVEKLATSTKSQLSFEHSVTNAKVVHTGEAVVSELKSYLAGVAQQFKTDVASELMAFLSSQIDSRQQMLIEQAPQPPKVPSREERQQKEAKERTKQAKRRAFIREALIFNGAVFRADLAENVRALWTSGIVAQDRVHFLLGEYQLAHWLAEPSNTILLINGNNVLSPERDTSVSFVAAKLIQTFSAAPASHNNANITSVGLYFFCADHLRNADNLSGPAGLLQSFIGQLDMRQLWSIFETLVCGLPRTVVLYCVLDSITEYEFSPWRRETEYLVESLIALSRRLAQEDSCTLKVLLTSPLTSRSIHHSLERWEVLDMPDKVPAVGGISDSSWDASGVSGFFEHKRK